MSGAQTVCVAGGGAAGLMAAISAARFGREQDASDRAGIRVLLLERKPRVGKKLLATGNGRCNLTNQQAGPPHYYGQHPAFALPALSGFSVSETLRFFEGIGLLWKEEGEGRCYPLSDTATAVLDLLRMEAEHLGIETVTDFDIEHISRGRQCFALRAQNGATHTAGALVAAMGGMASPALGSNGGGYRLLRELGHSVTPLSPAIVQLKTDPAPKALQGIKVEGSVRLYRQTQLLGNEAGDVLFTDYGISGPPVLQLSRHAADGVPLRLTVDFLPGYTLPEVIQLLHSRQARLGYRPMEDFLVGIVPKRVGQFLAKQAGVEKLTLPAGGLSPAQGETLAQLLKALPLTVTGTKGWEEAQVTAGGLCTDEFDANTLESRVRPGLFAAGELLDIHGDCGGYNLQWAWSSGWVAGRSAAKKVCL